MPTPEIISAELTNLTTEALSGVGVFDTLMRSTRLHLQDEYDSQRITGHEYAAVYLGALTAVLQTSAQFLVNVAATTKIDAEIIAMQAQTINENARVANDVIRTSNETTRIAAEIEGIEANTANTTRKITQEILLMASQEINDTTRTTNDTAKTAAEVSALTSRTANETLKIAAEITAMEANTINTTNKVDAEVLLLETQKTNDTARTTNDTTRVSNETAKITAENNALASRTTAEVKLLNQKVATEVANVSDTIPSGTGVTSGAIQGITGSQKLLYAAQAEGFERDAEQKLAKILADTWSVQQSMSAEVDPLAAGFGEIHIKDVINKARAGIGCSAI